MRQSLNCMHNLYMIISINDQRTLKEIQLEFSRYYPYLRLEFLQATERETPFGNIDLHVKAGTIRKKHHSGELYIFHNTKVGELEAMMIEQFGLSVEIYHYTKGGWIQTDVTNMATLNELNEQGRSAFHELHNVAAQSKNLY